jgi:hypothetical protein
MSEIIKIEDLYKYLPVTEAKVKVEMTVDEFVKIFNKDDPEHIRMLRSYKKHGKLSNLGRGPNTGVGAFVERLMKEGQTDNFIINAVNENYGNRSTTIGCVRWYRNNFNKFGHVGMPRS